MFDIHNHILPGVDDGSSCIEESLLLVKEEYEQGVRSIVLTPHFRKGMFDVSPEDRLNVFRETSFAISKTYPDMKVYLGCEVYLDVDTVECFANPVNRMLGSNIVLVEFCYDISFVQMMELIKNVQNQGFTVIIAHIERYDALRGSINNVRLLKTMGCYLQVNAATIAGKHGFMNRLLADKYLGEGIVDFVASDCHDVKNRKVYLDKAYKRIKRKFGNDIASDLFCKNAEALLIRKGYVDEGTTTT